MNIADTCINLEYWPSHFKSANTVIIPKLNKNSYSTPNPSVLSSYSILLVNLSRKSLAIDFNFIWWLMAFWILINLEVSDNSLQLIPAFTSLISFKQGGFNNAIPVL